MKDEILQSLKKSPVTFNPLMATEKDKKSLEEAFEFISEEMEVGDETFGLCVLAKELKRTMPAMEMGYMAQPYEAGLYLLMSIAVNKVFSICPVEEETFAQGWADDLLSGKYTRAQSYLKEVVGGVERYCCLGVLCEKYLSGSWRNKGSYQGYVDEIFNETHELLLPGIIKWMVFGEHTYIEKLLVSANDIEEIEQSVPESILDTEYGLVIPILRYMPSINDCGILFRPYDDAVRLLKRIAGE